ncbi:hypothetical protein AAFC00_001635 [Neodothiora populina]
MESLEHMPHLQKYIKSEGTSFENHFCTIAICCPSRVNLWTGRAAHNTNVTDVKPPYGGYPKIVSQGINDDYLPVWMQAAGYQTYYVGKLWNTHNLMNYDKPHVKGFNSSDFLLDPFTYDYWHAKITHNGGAPVDYSGQYSPDVVAEKAYALLDEATENREPFFLTVAPVAPHSNILGAPTLTPLNDSYSAALASGSPGFAIPEYAPRHAHLFKDYKIPRREDFNPEKPSGANWIAQLPRLNDSVIAYNDEFQRARLRALQSVDEMIEQLITKLDDKGILDNTYIFFTTDNGFHISQHRMHPGKECGYDTDIHIPLIVRGPGIAKGESLELVSSHTDIAPTILSIAGVSRDDLDGLPIPLTSEAATTDARGEHVNVEFWGEGLPEGKYGVEIRDYPNNTYKSLRLVSDGYSLYYSVWCTGEREYYDLKHDPFQMKNYFVEPSLADSYELLGRPFNALIYRLDALLVVLKECRGRTCTHPWEAHATTSLKDALDPGLDAYYISQPKVVFSSCELGYIKEAEGNRRALGSGKPDNEYAGSSGDQQQQTFRYTGRWHDWV